MDIGPLMTMETNVSSMSAKTPHSTIKVEPKVFFANERTFIAWLHVSTILAGGGIAIVAFANANPLSQMYGVVLLPISIAFIAYAMWQCKFYYLLYFITHFHKDVKRAAMIRRHEPGPYEGEYLFMFIYQCINTV